jgi:hypothetical protein
MEISTKRNRNHRTIYPPYFPYGLKLFILSGLLIALYSFSFRDSINATINYKKDVCIIQNIDLIKVDVDCLNPNGNIYIVSMPCVLILVNTKNYNNIKYYRNYEEKTWILENDVNVSVHFQDSRGFF